MNIPFVGTIENGKILHDFPERFAIHLAKLEGKRVTVTVKRFYKTNTPKQKGYLHGVVIPITTAFMDYPRHEREHVYNTLKSEYLKAYDEKDREYIRELKGA